MINIQDIIPFMKKGYVYCEQCGEWFYVQYKPRLGRYGWCPTHYEFPVNLSSSFNIEPIEDYTNSLIKVDGK